MEKWEETVGKPDSLLDLRLLMQEFIEIKRPELEEYQFDIDDYEYELPEVELKSRYIYSYSDEAMEAANKELTEKVYDKLGSVIEKFAKDYEEKELAPLLKSEDKPGDFYYELKKRLSSKLKFYVEVLEELTGEKCDFNQEFYEFKTKLDLAFLDEVLNLRYETFAEDVFTALPKIEDYSRIIITDCDKIEVSNIKNEKEVEAVEQENLFKPLDDEGKEFNLFADLDETKEPLENGIIERWGYDLTPMMKLLKTDLMVECSDYLVDYGQELMDNVLGSFEDGLNEEWMPKEAVLLELINEATLKE